MAHILDKLITLTIEEVEMYPSIQAKIWGNIGQVSELIDMVLDSFIKRSVTGGLGSAQVTCIFSCRGDSNTVGILIPHLSSIQIVEINLIIER